MATFYVAGKVNQHASDPDDDVCIKSRKWQFLHFLPKDIRKRHMFIESKSIARNGSAVHTIEALKSIAMSGEEQEEVENMVIDQLDKSNKLIALLESPDSYGTIAEIAYMSGQGKPCFVFINYEDRDKQTQEAMEDAYWLVCNFPKVEVQEVKNLHDYATKVCDSFIHSSKKKHEISSRNKCYICGEPAEYEVPIDYQSSQYVNLCHKHSKAFGSLDTCSK